MEKKTIRQHDTGGIEQVVESSHPPKNSPSSCIGKCLGTPGYYNTVVIIMALMDHLDGTQQIHTNAKLGLLAQGQAPNSNPIDLFINATAKTDLLAMQCVSMIGVSIYRLCQSRL